MQTFLEGYLECLFFTDCNEIYERDEWETEEVQDDIREGRVSGNIPKDADVSDIDSDTMASIEAECRDFQAMAADLLTEAYSRGYSEARAGHDFWLTRNGHGAGFWDRKELEAGDLGDKLSDIARKFGNVDSYWGDEGGVYLA